MSFGPGAGIGAVIGGVLGSLLYRRIGRGAAAGGRSAAPPLPCITLEYPIIAWRKSEIY